MAASIRRVQHRNDMTAALAGAWARKLPDGDAEQLKLFASSTLAFQHSAALPMYQAVGTWNVRDGALELEIASCERCPPTSPLAQRLAVTLEGDGRTLHLDGDGERSTWRRVLHPYGTSPGVHERAAKDERGWTYLLGVAHGKAQCSPPGPT